MSAKHRQAQHRRAEPRRLPAVALAAVTVVAVALATVAVVNGVGWFHPPGGATAVAATGTPTDSAAVEHPTGSADLSTATDQHGASNLPGSPEPLSSPPRPLHVIDTSPTTTAAGTTPIVVRFDAPIAADGLLPEISPDTPGRWTSPGPTTLRFDPDVPFVPGLSVRIDVPAGMQSADGGTLATGVHATFQVAGGSVLRLQQLLAELGYLPLTFTADEPEPNTPAAQGVMAFDPPAGSFAFRFSPTPEPLARLWVPGKATAMTKGAVMAFENVHHLAIDGLAGPAVWTALLRDAVSGAVDPQPYSWAWATKTRPETLHIWRDGTFILASEANTGIPAAPTPTGSWPIYARYRSQTMQGTNPDGSHYRDPGVPYISYFNGGDAIHGFKRSSYGTPQSLGCIELPYDAAARVWQLIDYGTVVTVTR
jgi:peptidoglycan hydrolase-like protein with peptidoglycan-binding domain